MERTFTLSPRGPFSLEEVALFGFGQRHATRFDGCMRLAFCLDGYQQQVGVEVRRGGKEVTCRALGEGPLEAIGRQVARVLSLDHDGEGFVEVGRRDPVIDRLQRVAPGLRPPLFYSPYEAAAWAIISARRPARLMAAVRDRLSREHGRRFVIAGEPVAAFPLPGVLADLNQVPGLSPQKVERLHGVARAALAGGLDVDRLAALAPEQAMAELQKLAGIGSFYSALIVARATGLTDVLPTNEPKVLEMAARLYGRPAPLQPVELQALAERWRPFRTWAVVLIRAAGARLLASSAERPPLGGRDRLAPSRVAAGRAGAR